ncbi:MAG TPA: sulfotransferase [Solirubrobacteraceae bacterium]|jgi:hypothetical protein|nr:sulfotransferase [Solirubrobacteraceae bacterium]
MGEAKPKVVYVMGTGRSGSTILGIALGNCPRILYAGELHLWIGKSGFSPLGGEKRERFWSEVRELVEIPAGFPVKKARALEKTAGLFSVGTWFAQRRLRPAYRRMTADLYRAIAQVAGATHIVDTSHFPRRARQLQALEEIELHLLFVVRDPQNVVGSYSRDDVDFPRFNILTTNAYMWLSHLLSLYVFLRQPRERRLLVRYEELIADPDAVLAGILAAVGSPEAVPDLGALETGVAFQGNGLLRDEVVALEPQPLRAAPGSRLTRLLNLPWKIVFSKLEHSRSGSSDEAGRPT